MQTSCAASLRLKNINFHKYSLHFAVWLPFTNFNISFSAFSSSSFFSFILFYLFFCFIFLLFWKNFMFLFQLRQASCDRGNIKIPQRSRRKGEEIEIETENKLYARPIPVSPAHPPSHSVRLTVMSVCENKLYDFLFADSIRYHFGDRYL